MKIVEKCSFCGCGEFTLLFRVRSMNNDSSIMRCNSCRLAFLNPRPEHDEIDSTYSSEYFKDHVKPEILENREQAGTGLLKRLQKYVREKGRVLDIGAATGAYLSAFKKAGWDVYGVELSDFARDAAKRIFGITMSRDLEAASFKDGYFDLILMNQVIEHLPSHIDLLKEIHRILKPGGTLFISTPNFGSHSAKYLKASWPSLKPDEHLYFFTPKTLKMMVLAAGFSIVKCDTMQPLITTPHFEKLLGVKKAGLIRRAANILFPGVKRSARNIIGKFFPGDGIEIIVTK